MRNKFLKAIMVLAITGISILSFPLGASAEWKQDNKGWQYTEGNSYATGWKLIGGNWYYFYSNGYMATCDKIDGYFVNSSGAWTDSITAEEARQLILNEDGNYISGWGNDGKLLNDYKEYSSENMPVESWNISREPVYEFGFCRIAKNGEILNDIGTYLVGKESKNVYVLPNQGLMSAYQIENNQKVKTFKYKGEFSTDWHRVGGGY